MNFRPHPREEPELNLIPLIDVLIVLMIFLVLTTTFSRETQLKVSLPQASGNRDNAGQDRRALQVDISAEGQYRINQHALPDSRPATLKQALQQAAGDQVDPLIVIQADRKTHHQSVINVLDMAAQLGYTRIRLTADASPGPSP